MKNTLFSKEALAYCSRHARIERGELVDVSNMAAEIGFRWPVAVSRAVWRQYIEWPKEYGALQDTDGRMWDVLSMLFFAIKAPSAKKTPNILFYELLVVPRLREYKNPRKVKLKSVLMPDDNRQPTITVMLPMEYE